MEATGGARCDDDRGHERLGKEGQKEEEIILSTDLRSERRRELGSNVSDDGSEWRCLELARKRRRDMRLDKVLSRGFRRTWWELGSR